eukprot:14528571-Alexandrium_andersonii.AAC.1
MGARSLGARPRIRIKTGSRVTFRPFESIVAVAQISSLPASLPSLALEVCRMSVVLLALVLAASGG